MVTQVTLTGLLRKTAIQAPRWAAGQMSLDEQKFNEFYQTARTLIRDTLENIPVDANVVSAAVDDKDTATNAMLHQILLMEEIICKLHSEGMIDFYQAEVKKVVQNRSWPQQNILTDSAQRVFACI